MQPTFEFIDEPQFRTVMTRAETANKLRSYRCRANGNAARYKVQRISLGHYLVRLRSYDAPCALITTK